MTYADYLMIISPPDAIKKEISRYKRASANLIGHFESMHSAAHITITHQVRCKPFLVHPTIARMEKRLAIITPIDLQITGFNYFNHGKKGKTIYAAVEITPKTKNWFKLLKLQIGIKPQNFVPHITIARNIPVTSFNKLWPNFENRQWETAFMANCLTILERDTYVEYCEWKIYRDLWFGDKLLAF